ncbi:MAG: Fe-S cluster assembly ATPase SufC [Patescibacteria group bacterium]
MNALKIENLKVSREGKEIVKGLSLEVKKGEVHALMGPNGSGKSTLAGAIAGHPSCVVTAGRVLVDGVDVTSAAPHERAKAGIFLSMQSTPEIPGVTLSNFLRTAYNAVKDAPLSVMEFHALLQARMEDLKIDPLFARRHLNAGFSGGEKKRAEVLQLSVLDPAYAVLDETDSGLDVDALKIVTDGLARLRGERIGILVISHNPKMLEALAPDVVHVMKDGMIVAEGGKELAERIGKEGYESVTK